MSHVGALETLAVRTRRIWLLILVAIALAIRLSAQDINTPKAGAGHIIGTVTDVNGDIVLGATVVLEGPVLKFPRTVVSNDNGFFEFNQLAAGTYQVIVSALGFANWTSPAITLEPGQYLIVTGATLHIAGALTTVTVASSAASPEELSAEQVKILEQQRVFGFIPNFYVSYDPNAPPLTSKSKFQLAAKGAKWVQFIPIIERADTDTIDIANQGWSEQPGRKRLLYMQSGSLVTKRSVGGEQYGRFLVDVFEEWVRHDVGEVYIQMFDVTLEAYFGHHVLCIHAPTCGLGPALEYNGDVYSCDHFVEPRYKLGNIHETNLVQLVASAEQRKFGDDKRDSLTPQCQSCAVKHLCNGGCPKDRFRLSRDGDPGHNYLCAGLELFFKHTRPAMQTMAQLLQRNRPPSDVMALIAAEDAKSGPYAPCPCLSGKKLRFCHGDRPPQSPFSRLGLSTNRAELGVRQ